MFHCLLVFFCHFFFLLHAKRNKIVITKITFAHLQLASIRKRIWEACEILNLKHGSIACWYSFVILFFLYYSKRNKFFTTKLTFAHLQLASIWIRIWEACEILNLKHGSIACWYSFVILFFLYYSKRNKFITTKLTFAHLQLASIRKRIWEACEILNLKHGSIACWYSFVILFFLLHAKRNKIVITKITFAHLQLASIRKRIWEACEILNLKHGSIACW